MRLAISLIALSVCFPRLLCGLLKAFYQNKSIDVFSQTIIGKNMNHFVLKTIKVGNKPLLNVDLWFHYMKGNIDLVGPKPLTLDEAKGLATKYRSRFNVCPGFISPFQVKRKSGIAYSSEMEESLAFSAQVCWQRRIQIFIAFLFQTILGGSSKALTVCKRLSFFGVPIKNVSMSEAINMVMNMTDKPRIKGKLSHVSFINADCVNKYVVDENYRRVLNACHSVFADGIGMRIAARWHKSRLAGNVNGTDMLPLLCVELEKSEQRLFLYGASAKAVQATAQRLTKMYPKLNIVGYLDGYAYKNNAEFVCSEINRSGADVLLVALGAPQQEEWISDNSINLKVKVAIGVGGLFDFYSGQVSRAPNWVREMSLEWVWRLLVQPRKKAKRYLCGNPLFLFRILFSKSNHDQFGRSLEVL